MIPVAFNLGFLTIYTFPIFFLLAISGGAFLIWREAKNEDFDVERLFDAVVVSVFFAILAGRLTQFILAIPRFGSNWTLLLNFQQLPGFDLPTAFLAGGLALYFFTKQIKINFWETADYLVIGLAFFQFLVAVGHSVAGLYTNSDQNSWTTSFFLLVLLIMLRIRRRVHFAGFAILVFVFLDSVLMLTLALQKVDSVYWISHFSKDRLFWFLALILSVALLYKKTKRDVFYDLKGFYRFLEEDLATFGYVLRSKRARRKLKVKASNFWSKRHLAISASVFKFISTTKGVFNVKKTRKH